MIENVLNSSSTANVAFYLSLIYRNTKRLQECAPLILTHSQNASITVCMASGTPGDRSHIGDGQQNEIPPSQL